VEAGRSSTVEEGEELSPPDNRLWMEDVRFWKWPRIAEDDNEPR